MRIRFYSIVTAAAVLAVLSMNTMLDAAQAGQQGGGAAPAAQAGQGGGGQRGAQANQPPAGPVPRMANGKPDLSGHWTNPYTPNMAAGMSVLDPATRQPLMFARKGEALPDAAGATKTFDLPYTEWGLNEWKKYDPAANGDYAGSCLPFGLPRSINSPHGTQIVHNPDALAFLFEQNTWFHWVPTRADFKWPADLPPNWNGLSTGRWDGDTLIIESYGFNGYTKLDTNGHPHSKELKITQTFTRTDSRTMTHTFTVHDPKTYTQDWMNVRTWRLKTYPDVIMEYSCEENNLGLDDGSITKWKYPESED